MYHIDSLVVVFLTTYELKLGTFICMLFPYISGFVGITHILLLQTLVCEAFFMVFCCFILTV